MLGSIVNAAAVFVGALIGVFFHRGIPQRFNHIVTHGVGLAVILIGIKGALEVTDVPLMIISLVVGGVIGEWIDIEKGLENLGKSLQKRFSRDGSDFAKGFVTTSLMFCVGSMAIIGALDGGLRGDHATLYAKSVIDFIMSIVFASSMGIGVFFSGFAVLVYEGGIALLASSLKDILVGDLIVDMSAVGGLLIAALGFKMVFDLEIRVGNLLPSIFVPVVYYTVMNFI
ncbi:MAG: hypothetical protein AVO33_07890 [delta proteobacterium ML8_F1]|nr:MAG: hypothetical protein AVO33_07890 [delta proteobacterium ML8_F1]